MRISDWSSDVCSSDLRSYQPGIPKAHYGFSLGSTINDQYSGKILLDVLTDSSVYPELIKKSIQTKWIETESETIVVMPSLDSITGDKLTAFAPNTIGIPYRSEEHTSELQSLMRISYAVFCLKKKKIQI